MNSNELDIFWLQNKAEFNSLMYLLGGFECGDFLKHYSLNLMLEKVNKFRIIKPLTNSNSCIFKFSILIHGL
jgi:hypothetical protein